MFGFTLAGLFAHAVFLVLQTNMNLAVHSPLANWSGWCLFAAFGLVICYLWITYRHPDAQTGVFILPFALALIGLGQLMNQTPGFSQSSARTIWNSIHGGSLLLATVVIFLGFVMGVMYLVHSYRLKQKKKSTARFKLPSLEWLHKSTERTLVISTVLMAFGVISGFVINQVNADSENATLRIGDPIVWSSLVMFGWLFVVTLVSRFYQPARSGRKMAYLILSCFVFLVLELALVLSAQHGSSPGPEKNVQSSELKPAAPSAAIVVAPPEHRRWEAGL